ncbi:MAG: hypothetical protein QOF20_1025, partial [Acidimicrobiaceae bacterium]|nr:hypothetical protein [Acidimicrobiaceae bacterium]
PVTAAVRVGAAGRAARPAPGPEGAARATAATGADAGAGLGGCCRGVACIQSEATGFRFGGRCRGAPAGIPTGATSGAGSASGARAGARSGSGSGPNSSSKSGSVSTRSGAATGTVKVAPTVRRRGGTDPAATSCRSGSDAGMCRPTANSSPSGAASEAGQANSSSSLVSPPRLRREDSIRPAAATALQPIET